jgi:hypothetical protein
MSLLNQVTTGKIARSICILVYGPDGLGKTTLGSQAPASIFLGPELGTANMDVARFPSPKKWADVQAAVNVLITEPHNYKTLVIDSLDWLEPLLFKQICEDYNVKSIELAAGGYGKGYVEATTRWGLLKDQLEQLRSARGMNIVLIAHSEVVSFLDPATQLSYQRYELKLQKRASALWREYVDAVLFANYETFARKEGNAVQAFSDGARVMHTERRPGWDAKNRFGLPLKLDLSWDALFDAIQNAQPESMEAVKAKIEGLLTLVTDPELKEKVIDTFYKAGDDLPRLNAIANRLALRVG